MVENKGYLMDIFIDKLNKIYNKNNPFKKSIYALDTMAYLYNRRYINVYNKNIKILFDEEHQLLSLPKNEYRIIR